MEKLREKLVISPPSLPSLHFVTTAPIINSFHLSNIRDRTWDDFLAYNDFSSTFGPLLKGEHVTQSRASMVHQVPEHGVECRR